ncbi:DUF541 domain-containing protein [Verticiella sediminum]|uniref:DUF541 domain-containing protein n=1 Tax=Verticiella sediminum TaxID=1247510 RepID=A0A556AMV8_9BURK|nr:SIMPL domain-containing protein [Verticiella sediminum]TSH94207.1 DUF541 domain-containing protein [Verticiella sediminum]
MSLRALLRTAPLALAALPLLAAQAIAQPAPPDTPRPHERGEPRGQREPRLTLQAEAVSEVTQDKVQITLATEIEGAEQADVSQRLTKTVNDTLAAVKGKAPASVQVRTGNYRLWPNTDRDGKITGWRGRGEVVLESNDLPAASKLAAEAGAMSIADVAFSLSREAREAEEKRLLGEAAEAFRQRAADAAKAFGFADYRIRSIDLSGSGSVYPKYQPQMMRAGVADAAAAPLQFEAGMATVTVTVQGEVVLQTSGK